MSYSFLSKPSNYCKKKCLYEHTIPQDKGLPAIFQNTGIQQIKIHKGGGTPQFRHFEINQYGRYKGTGGQPLNNFI
jgi:hypothetical protein